MTYSQVQVLCSAFTHPKCTHTAANTHIHTPQAVGSHSCCGDRGAGFVALLEIISVMVLRALDIHSPNQSLPDRDSNSQPFNYESESLTIRPRLPHKHKHIKLYQSSSFYVHCKGCMLYSWYFLWNILICNDYSSPFLWFIKVQGSRFRLFVTYSIIQNIISSEIEMFIMGWLVLVLTRPSPCKT